MEYLIILLATLFFPIPVLLLHSSHILFELKVFLPLLCRKFSSLPNPISSASENKGTPFPRNLNFYFL